MNTTAVSNPKVEQAWHGGMYRCKHCAVLNRSTQGSMHSTAQVLLNKGWNLPYASDLYIAPLAD